MPCNLDKDGVNANVIAFFQAVYPNRSDLSRDTRLGRDLGLSSTGKRSLYFPVWKRFKELGCPTGVAESDFDDADTIGDIADAFWGDIGGSR